MNLERINFTLDMGSYRLLKTMVKNEGGLGIIPNRSDFLRKLIIKEAEKRGLIK
jgi:hypothetical protein